MDAFTVAGELIPGIRLSPGQRAELRALNHEYYTRLFALSRTPGRNAEPSMETTHVPRTRELTPDEAGQLRAMLVAGIHELLTPAQRRSVGQ
ncbi:MAG: hypothetical protein ACREKM_00600 [Longimicrobiales bacterium]